MCVCVCVRLPEGITFISNCYAQSFKTILSSVSTQIKIDVMWPVYLTFIYLFCENDRITGTQAKCAGTKIALQPTIRLIVEQKQRISNPTMKLSIERRI